MSETCSGCGFPRAGSSNGPLCNCSGGRTTTSDAWVHGPVDFVWLWLNNPAGLASKAHLATTESLLRVSSVFLPSFDLCALDREHAQALSACRDQLSARRATGQVERDGDRLLAKLQTPRAKEAARGLFSDPTPVQERMRRMGDAAAAFTQGGVRGTMEAEEAMEEPEKPKRVDVDELVNGHELLDYLDALSGVGPLAHDWRDKPHRLVYDLVAEVRRLRGG